MTFNDILVEGGGFGLYQKLLTFVCLASTLVMVAFNYWTQVFMLLIPPHRCKRSLNDTKWDLISEVSDYAVDAYKNETHVHCDKGFVYDFSVNFPTYASEVSIHKMPY